MNKYELIYISKENQNFSFKTMAKNEEDSKKNALKKIEELMYDIYDYKFKSINNIKE